MEDLQNMSRPNHDDDLDEEVALLHSNVRRFAESNGKNRSLWSSLIFEWLYSILYTGSLKKRLEPDDLDLVPLPTNCSSEVVYEQFKQFWDEEIAKNPTKPSMIKTLFQAFGKDFVYAGFLKLCADICLFVGPQVLREMIIYLRDEEIGHKTLRRGLSLTGSVIVSQIIMSLCLSHYYFKCSCIGLRVRNALIVTVYRKSLILSPKERQNKSLGEITNLISIDAERLLEWMPYVHYVWSVPFQIVVALFFLWKDLGPSSLGALVIIVIMIPISKILSDWLGGIQEDLMSAIDNRVEFNSEMLSNMKTLKLQAWEECFQRRLLALREIELKQIYQYFVADAVSGGMWSLAPLIISLSAFTPFVVSGHKLDLASALTALALFGVLRAPLGMLPRTISCVVETKISIDRLLSFLCCDEYKPVSEGSLRNHGVDMSDVTAIYSKKQSASDLDEDSDELDVVTNDIQNQEEEGLLESVETNEDVVALNRVSLRCQPGDFLAIVGSVGSGKSSIINSIIGEITQLSGQTLVKGKLAYFSENPFILNASVRDNIIFGHLNEPIDEDLYQRCLDCCALTHDLTLLSSGDLTEIGERGVTLSGGQKARVALARAVYHKGDITLLDNVLSAVDNHVAKHLFENAIISELLTDNRSVIIVTNALHYLNHPRVSQIFVMNEGSIVERGTYTDLVGNVDSEFCQMILAMEKTSAENNSTYVSEPSSVPIVNLQVKSNELAVTGPTGDSRLITEETRKEGNIGFDVYITWAISAGGVMFPLVVIFTFLLFESTSVLSNFWLTYWSTQGESAKSQMYFLAVYAGINLSAALFDFIRALSVGYFSLRASSKLFRDMLQGVMYAKMSFYDTTPIGRLVNRFSSDIYCIDEELTGTMVDYLATIFQVVSTIIVISIVNPVFIICVIPLLNLYYSEQSFFTVSYRELRRLESVAGSPIYALLGESVDGAAVIRAYSAQETLFERMIEVLNKQQHAHFLIFAGGSWLQIRLEFIGTLIIAFTCLATVIQHVMFENSGNYAGLAGLAISYALSVTSSLQWSVQMASEMEANMVSVERVGECISLESEGLREANLDDEIQLNWPTLGEIEFQNVQMRYRPEQPLVLNGLNIHIPAGSKVGVVGRTGAGKSSLMVALLRIVELTDGKILIDKTDIGTLGLNKLRQNIAVIPQDPVLFSGTIRTNLDPFDEYTDEALYDVLEQVGLYKPRSISSSSSSLKSLSNVRVNSVDDIIIAGGANFSNGQRQLIVIARALLRDQKVVISDEATASIDNETDDAIQKVLRTKFVSATCITIAHRLNTIMDSDYILVMHDGKAAEFDTPKNLLQKGGMFRDLVNAASTD